RSAPYQPATFQANISTIAITNKSALVLAVPAIMKFQFRVAPKKAAIPTNAPKIKAIPIRTSPNVTNLANQVYHSLLSINRMNSRYQSKAIAGLPLSGIAAALVQKPFSAVPPSIQAGLPNLP